MSCVFIIITCLLLLPAPVRPGETGDILRLNPDVKSAAFGSAGIATTSHPRFNPAAAKIDYFRGAHSQLVEDIQYNRALISYSDFETRTLLPVDRISFGIEHLNFGSADETLIDGNAPEITGSSVESKDMLFNFALAGNPAEGLTIGGAINHLRSDIADENGEATFFDIGVQYELLDGFWFGGSAMNLSGKNIKYIEETEKVLQRSQLGVSLDIIEFFNLDPTLAEKIICHIDNSDEGVHTGIDYQTSNFSFRVGSNPAADETVNSLTAGIGLQFGNIGIDYAWQEFGDFGTTHSFSLTYNPEVK